MAVEVQRVGVEEFEALALLPENADRRLELIDGEIVELVSNQECSRIAGWILYFINAYLLEHDIGFATSADGGYQVGRDRYIPDVGFMSRARQPEASTEAYNPLPPDLAVEVVSPSEQMGDVLAKVNNYLLAGTVVWVFFPTNKEVGVFVPGQPARSLGMGDTLDGGDVLPGFKVVVKDVFRE